MACADAPEKMLRDPDEEVRLLGLRALSREGVETHLPLFYECLGDESWRVRKEAVQIVLTFPRIAEYSGEIVEFLHSEDNAGLRNAAVEILVNLAGAAVPYLVEELTCPDHDVRKFALDILGEIGDDSCLNSIIESLNDPDLNVRAAAAENLGKIGAQEAVPALLKAMEEDDLWFRFTILEALGQIGAEISIEKLLPFLKDALLRKALYDCLGKVGGTESFTYLVEGLQNEMRNVRESAASSILSVVKRFPEELESKLLSLAGTPASESIAVLLSSPSISIQRTGLALLGMIGDDRYLKEMIELSAEDSLRPDVAKALTSMHPDALCALLPEWHQADVIKKILLAYAFGESSCKNASTILLDALSSEEEELRQMSALSLGKIKARDALPSLIRLFGDESEDVRNAALESVCTLGAEYKTETVDALKSLLVSPDPETRTTAVLVLGRLDGPEAETSIAFALKDESPLVRQAAVRALDGKSGEDRLQTLMFVLTDEDSEVRRLAVEAIALTADPSAIQPLELAIMDEDIWVRSSAVRGLGKFNSPASVDLVIRALDDPVGLVVIAALETLSMMGSDRALSAFEKSLSHPDEEVVNAALQLLANSGDKTWLNDNFESLINHSSWEVRNTFVRVLAELEGGAARSRLEARLIVEEEELVRHHIADILATMGQSER